MEMDLCKSASLLGANHTPKVSVIVPVYKVEKYLPECIESVLAQTFTDFELILVDDGSPDNSGKICDDYATRDSRIRVFHKENGGVSSARNLGIKNARADYIAFLDSDDWWKPEFLEKMTALTEKFPQACCYCCCWTNVVGKDVDFTRVETLRGVPLGESVFFDVIKYSAEKGRLPIWTGAVVAKKSAIEAVGGFDENLIVYEDYALWFELCLMNDGCVAYLNDALSFYRLDSPVANKPRGILPPLEKHWVSCLCKYNANCSNVEVRRFLNRFALYNLIRYRIQYKNHDIFRKVLKEIHPNDWDWKFHVVYRTPEWIGEMMVFLSTLKTRVLKKIGMTL